MLTRIILALAIATQLSACVATPRVEMTEKINFDAPAPSQQSMSYNDLLCCYDCTA